MTREVTINEAGICVPNPGGQATFAADWTHPFVALEGGWGSGKTWVGARKLVTLHLHNAFNKVGEATHVPSAAIAPTFANAKEFVVPELRIALDEAGLEWEWRATDSEFHIRSLGTTRKLSRILVRSADRPERLTGWEAGVIWGDEPTRWPEDRHDPRRDAYLQLTGRLRHPLARLRQLMFTYTNEGDATRIYHEFHAGRPSHALYRASTRENPVVQEFCEMQRELLTEELAEQYLEGRAVSLRGGRVYGTFDPNVNVDDRVALTDNLPLQLALDFNISPGMHGELGQYRPAEDLFVVTHEIHAPRLDVRGLVERLGFIVRELGGWQWPELHVFGDAAGASEWAGTGGSCYEILRQGLAALAIPFRFRVPKANPPVVDRINAMNVAMKDLAGGVHWKCHSRCQRLISDLQELRRDEYGEIDKAERRLSHASDAEGYRVHYLRPARLIRDSVGGRVIT